jgi:hypothetical protein
MVARNSGDIMENNHIAGGENPPGIIIQHPSAPERRPLISAFIWGGKVPPVPSLPYGRVTA